MATIAGRGRVRASRVVWKPAAVCPARCYPRYRWRDPDTYGLALKRRYAMWSSQRPRLPDQPAHLDSWSIRRPGSNRGSRGVPPSVARREGYGHRAPRSTTRR